MGPPALHPSQRVRPIHWSNRPRAYLMRTAAWDKYPDGEALQFEGWAAAMSVPEGGGLVLRTKGVAAQPTPRPIAPRPPAPPRPLGQRVQPSICDADRAPLYAAPHQQRQAP